MPKESSCDDKMSDPQRGSRGWGWNFWCAFSNTTEQFSPQPPGDGLAAGSRDKQGWKGIPVNVSIVKCKV